MIRKRSFWAVVVLAVVAVGFALRKAGGQFVYKDEQTAGCRAVVVFGGGLPFRAMEAADVYLDGKVKAVWLTQGPIFPEDVELRKLGIERPPEHVYNAQVLESRGVPASAVRVLEGRVQNTAEEVRRISRELDASPGECVVLVTSKVHSRRVRVVWDLLAGPDRQAYVRFARKDPFDPERWWANTDSILAVAREAGGIANALLGFPIATERDAEIAGKAAAE